MLNEKLGITVYGLGYVGLPTAIEFHKSGHKVIGVDVNEKIIAGLERGECHLSDNANELEIPLKSDNWRTSTFVEENTSDIIIITVPTPVNDDRTPNLSFVESAMKSAIMSITTKITPVIVLESTVFPGVTRNIAQEICKEAGFTIGEDFDIAYSPERVSPGELGRSAGEVPRIVGSDNEKIGEMLADLYSSITNGGCTYVGNIEVAEAAKLIENTQRDIDIAFVNELANVMPLVGVDAMDALRAAATKWNFHFHHPGIGVGGHCIPVDPYYYIQMSNENLWPSIISPAAREINSKMPSNSASKVLSLVEENVNSALILGYSYKPEVGDTRETPVREFTRQLSSEIDHLYVWDPLVDSEEEYPPWVESIDDPFSSIDKIDIVILATGHRACIELDWRKLIGKCKSGIVYDGPRSLERSELELIGWRYFGTGSVIEEKNG